MPNTSFLGIFFILPLPLLLFAGSGTILNNMNTLTKLKECRANRYLLLSILSMAFGSVVFGSVALYNTIKFRDMILYSDEKKIETEAKIRKKRMICETLVDVSVFFAAIHIFFIFAFILGTIATMNDYINTVYIK